MAEAWDTVFGTGFYRANVLGARLHVQSLVEGNKGTKLRVELYRKDEQEKIEINGVARDEQGNVHKVVIPA